MEELEKMCRLLVDQVSSQNQQIEQLRKENEAFQEQIREHLGKTKKFCLVLIYHKAAVMSNLKHLELSVRLGNESLGQIFANTQMMLFCKLF